MLNKLQRVDECINGGESDFIAGLAGGGALNNGGQNTACLGHNTGIGRIGGLANITDCKKRRLFDVSRVFRFGVFD